MARRITPTYEDTYTRFIITSYQPTNQPMTANTNNCQHEFARINGRTLKNALMTTKANHRFGKFGFNDWVTVCPCCDAYALGIETTHPWPFLCSDGVMRTASDFDHGACHNVTKNLNFSGFSFSESALASAIELIKSEDTTTKYVESLGEGIRYHFDTESVLTFSEAVCAWGRGQRVWANLVRRNHDKRKLGALLSDWLGRALEDEDENVIRRGIEINGLSVSFASKHLRMLAPERFAVLDSVLCEGLGFALNPKGYKLFLGNLRSFKAEYQVPWSLADIESAIFLLVRQQVRSS
ncbi:hypothetical protein [Methylotenera mobilis]|uniref:hypothetical protein n=2 Tax=Methylotenera TaxID=359407 RepID=UPI000375F3A5|nr:hypothetical protein [Methylotenera mobilis]MDP3777562.1 hypothetical protein [Methylotenera sp.]